MRSPMEPGSRLGKYEIVRRVAEGGMAIIYLARSAGPDGFSKPCALKVMRAEFSARPDMTRALIQEAKIAAALNHPNIVQVFDFGRADNNEYYLTMEWIDGVPLHRLMLHASRQKRALNIGTVAQIGLSIAEALAGRFHLSALSRGCRIDGVGTRTVRDTHVRSSRIPKRPPRRSWQRWRATSRSPGSCPRTVSRNLGRSGTWKRAI